MNNKDFKKLNQKAWEMAKKIKKEYQTVDLKFQHKLCFEDLLNTYKQEQNNMIEINIKEIINNNTVKKYNKGKRIKMIYNDEVIIKNSMKEMSEYMLKTYKIKNVQNWLGKAGVPKKLQNIVTFFDYI